MCSFIPVWHKLLWIRPLTLETCSGKFLLYFYYHLPVSEYQLWSLKFDNIWRNILPFEERKSWETSCFNISLTLTELQWCHSSAPIFSWICNRYKLIPIGCVVCVCIKCDHIKLISHRCVLKVICQFVNNTDFIYLIQISFHCVFIPGVFNLLHVKETNKHVNLGEIRSSLDLTKRKSNLIELIWDQLCVKTSVSRLWIKCSCLSDSWSSQ